MGLSRAVLATLLVLSLLLLAGWWFDSRLGPSFRMLARVSAEQEMIRLINQAVLDHVVPGLGYERFYKIRQDTQGRIQWLEANTAELARLKSEVVLAVQKALDRMGSRALKVPLGQVLGMETLAGAGPSIPLRVLPAGVVQASFQDQFSAAGINQTRHSVYLRIQTSVQVVAPMLRERVQVATDVPMVEAILPGEVPKTYLNWTVPRSP